MTLAPGVTIGQSLRLVRPLAKGGMGSLWVADHLGLKTQVAVKFIDDALGAGDNVLARFTQEAAAAAQIRSPHVVQIFDHGSVDGRIPYIVMELLEGESLGGRIGRLGPLAVDELAAVISQTCKALSKVHSLAIVHRDIKPDNIFLIDSDGELFVKLLDFGIAKRSADASLAMTSTGMAVGTPHYMSPEQLLSSKDVTPATDLWALGAVAYRALTGKVPFDGETYGAVCAAVSRGAFTPPRELRPDLPPALDAWFDRALAVDPPRRYASARELADAFVERAGLGAANLGVPSALPKSWVSGDSPSPAAAGSGETLTAAGSSGASDTRTALPGGFPALHSPSNASIGGASIPNGDGHGSGRRRSLRLVAGVVLALTVALLAGVALSRRGPAATQTNVTASAGSTASGPAPAVALSVAITPPAASSAPAASAPVTDRVATGASPSAPPAAPSSPGPRGPAGSPSPARPFGATVSPRSPGPGPRVGSAPAPPPSERETDHGF